MHFRDAEILRIHISESDRADGRPLYEALVARARKQGMAGATVLRGLLGFGAASHLHSAKILALSEDLPLVVEIVDSPGNIQGFLPIVEELVADGLVTRERVDMAVVGDHDRARHIMNTEERQ